MDQIALCSFEGAKWLIFSSNVPSLIYYTYVTNLVIGLFFAAYILLKNWRGLSNRVLFFTIAAFEIWIFFALVFWASNRGDIIMFSWLMDILVEPLVHIGALYLLYTLIEKKDVSFGKKLVFMLLYLPIPVLLPTVFTLSAFDPNTCLAVEGPIALYYTYALEVLVAIWTIIYSVMSYFRAIELPKKREILYLSLGTILLIIAFMWGNIVGSVTDDWKVASYGLFGMPVFIAFLSYSIVKYGTFNTKLIASYALVLSLAAANFSLILIDDPELYRPIALVTFVITIILGLSLIKAIVGDEKNQLRIQNLSKIKDEFSSLATHQLKTPISIILGEADYAKEKGIQNLTPEEAAEVVDNIFTHTRKLNTITTDIMSAMRMNIINDEFEEKDLQNVDVVALMDKVIKDVSPLAEKAKIILNFANKTSETLPVRSNPILLEQVFKIVVPNAITYTKQGSVDITILPTDNYMYRIDVKDTGIGVPEKDKNLLFEKFKRGSNAINAYAYGSGLGLYMCKKIVEAHGKGARIWFDSIEGKGTTFHILLPTIQTKVRSSAWNKFVGWMNT